MESKRAAQRAALERQIALLSRQAKESLKSSKAAEVAGKWTAASKYAELAAKATDALGAAEAELAELAEEEEPIHDPALLLEQISSQAMRLPSYVLDDLIAALERLRVDG